jgi:rod shape-determining protein MreD
MLEMVLNNSFGAWGKPELLLLLVVFWGLYSGIRYSIIAALLSGLLKDSISILPLGTNLLVFLTASYLTTLVRRNLYQPGSRFSRAVVTFFVLIGAFLVQAILYMMEVNVYGRDIFLHVFLPQLVTTMVVVTFVFHRLREFAFWMKL